MTTNPVELRPRNVGEIFGLTFDLYRKNFPLFIGIAAVILIPLLLLNAVSQIIPLFQFAAVPGAAVEPDASTDAIAASFLGLTAASYCLSALGLALGIFWPWMEGALTFNVIERVLGRAPGLRASYGQTRSRWGALWVSNILAQIGINLPIFVAYGLLFGGLVAAAATFAANTGSDVPADASPFVLLCLAVLCVPLAIGALAVSALLAINWAFRAPVIVGEGADGIQALRRSTAIARGDRWRILGRYLLLFALEFIVLVIPLLIVTSVILAGVFAGQRTPLGNFDFDTAALPTFIAISVIAIAFSFIGALLITPFRAIFTTVNYLDLRIRKEDLAAALLRASTTATATPAAAAGAPAIEPAPTAITSAPASPPVPPALPSGTSTTMTNLQPSGSHTDPGSITRSTHAAQVNLANLPPGQRVGVLFNRIRAEGESARLLNDLGLAFMEIGDYGGAMDALERAWAIAPDNAEVAYNLMILYQARKNTSAARQMMAAYLRLETDPDDLAAVRNNPRFKDLLPE